MTEINPADCPPNSMYRGSVGGITHILRRGEPENPKPWAALLSDFDYSTHADSEVSDLVHVGEFPEPRTEPVEEGYNYRVFWSEEDQEYVATVAEFPLLSYLDPDDREALKGIKDLVRDIIKNGTASSEEVRELLEREYGKDQVSAIGTFSTSDQQDVLRHVAAIIDHEGFDNVTGTLGEQVAHRLFTEGLLAKRWTR